jgi:CheY-like chemotaxis protein
VDINKIPSGGGYITCPTCSNKLIAKWDYSEGSAGKIRLSPADRSTATARQQEPRLQESTGSAGPAKPPEKQPEAAAPCTRVQCPRCGIMFNPGAEAKEQKDAVKQEPWAAPAPKRKSILVVDDHEFFRNFAVDILAGEYIMTMAKTVEEALGKINEEKPDLMILDLNLESGSDDGKVILQRMPKNSIPVIIMTGRTDFDIYGDDWRDLVALGADDLIIKGMDITDELKKKVNILLNPPIN